MVSNTFIDRYYYHTGYVYAFLFGRLATWPGDPPAKLSDAPFSGHSTSCWCRFREERKEIVNILIYKKYWIITKNKSKSYYYTKLERHANNFCCCHRSIDRSLVHSFVRSLVDWFFFVNTIRIRVYWSVDNPKKANLKINPVTTSRAAAAAVKKPPAFIRLILVCVFLFLFQCRQ